MSAIKRLCEAKANLLKRQKATQMIRQGIGLGGTLATFAGTQVDKAKTAWEEYEKGYKAITGDETDTSKKIWEKGWLKRTFGRPTGTKEIGGMEYDMKNIRKI